MKILFDNINILFEDGREMRNAYLSVEDGIIKEISDKKIIGDFDRTINGENKLICPGLYNCHAHSPMSLFRGYGENLPLDRWLNEKIWPAEDKLTEDDVYMGSMLSIAEMLKNGIVSFSDMYFFSEATAKAVAESGIKANIARCITEFDENITADQDKRFQEGLELVEKYHKAFDGRILIDMSIHAEYTTTASTCKYVSDYASENGLNIQIHLSETAKEHKEGIERRGGLTPTEFFYENGLFRAPVVAAHCVHVTDNDIKILAKSHAFVAHNPVSNLKLGSGIMNLTKMLDNDVTVVLGTDGSASNNTLDIMKEAYIASLLQKGTTGDTSKLDSGVFIKMATENGAISQGRADSGKIAAGYKADLILIDLNSLNTLPYFDLKDTFMFATNSSNVCLTMVNGEILYENGTFSYIDIEKLKYDFSQTIKRFYTK